MNLDKTYSGNSDDVLRGIPASSGIAVGIATVLKSEIFIDLEKKITNEEITNEFIRFASAKARLVNEINDALSKVPETAQELGAMLQADLMIVEDEFFASEIKEKIEQLFTTDIAIISFFEKHKNILKQSSDELFRERILELDNVEKRFLWHLNKKERIDEIPENAVIIAQSISPTELMNLKNKNVVAIITEVGGVTSHFAILARSYSLPAIISVNYATSTIKSGQNLIIDGFTGQIFINPDNDLLYSYRQKIEQIKEHLENLGSLINLESITKDGKKVELWCNANTIEDVNQANIVKSIGLGLVRTESLIISLNRFPTEEEQDNYYRQIVESAYPMQVTFRAFDIGSDKYSDSLLKREDNPALGFRGIRYLLSQKELFKSQIKSILKSSKNKNVRFMLPMVTSLEEVTQTFKIVNLCKLELDKEKIPYDKDLKIGVMIETPAAALISDELALISDFFSLGTNDLTQYILAADRTNELLSDFFNTFHPGVLRLIDFVINAAHRNNVPVAVCGEMASHPLATTLLVGMGIDELSVTPSLLLEVKEKIRSMEFEKAKIFVNKLLKSAVMREIFESIED